MYDLRTIAPIEIHDKITGKVGYKIPVNIIEISDKSKAYRIYPNNDGTKCRDIKVEVCGLKGNLIVLNAIMWETTYLRFKELNASLPQVTMAKVIENPMAKGSVIIIVYMLDYIDFLIEPNIVNDSDEKNKKFLNNYNDFFNWLKELKQTENS